MRSSFNGPAGYAGKDTGVPRRMFLAAGAARPLVAIRTRPANAAEFTYKLAAGQDPTHPVNKRSRETIDPIPEAIGGRLEIRPLPADQLSSDSDLLGQVRNGGVQFFNEASSILTTLVPAAGVLNVGFALSSADQVYGALPTLHDRYGISAEAMSRRIKSWL
jgi:TRAP-type C4-dicarboxylate transport system substrate-binding protein